jgi:hypothetical protein
MRTQITLESEMQRQARRRASEMGVSLAEYVRRLVAQDLARPRQKGEVSSIFGLGSSGGSEIAVNKHAMVAEVFSRASRKVSR